MNLKYYLRGLGIGIVVSTLIIGIAANNRTQTPSDEEIRQRAKELGMVEATGVLADEIPSAETLQTTEQKETEVLPTEVPKETASLEATPTKEPKAAPTEEARAIPSEEPKASPAEAPKESPTEAPKATPTAEVTKAQESPAPKEESASEDNDKAEEVKVTPTPVKKAESGEMISVTVKSGEGSYSVCKKLEAAGLVESAASYDTYLYEKGYDKRIIAASHEIPAGADEEQIAKILTGKN